ncbi:DNA topoisomerase 2 [Diplonema papillatum]|nr:DNA topoisomerase 2 [Diplonema papillatum]
MPSKSNDLDFDDMYLMMELREQIRHRPDTYVGSREAKADTLWVYDDEAQEMELRKVSWVPALYKIFDEILVNASDNWERDNNQTRVKVDINVEKGYIRVWNNGQGVPVHMHGKHNLYVPDMIFGYLLTSGNYNDTEKKLTGGRNGFGAKLANIFSTKFSIETVHTGTGKKFSKTWTDNMTKFKEATITNTTSKDTDYTCVTFWPDFKFFGLDGFDDDHLALFKKRVIDIAGCTDPKLIVYLNGTRAPVQKFKDYVDLYPGLGEEKMAESYAAPNTRWQICVRPSNIAFQQVSFVNSICTIRGGQHVSYIEKQVIDKVVEAIKKKNKKMDIPPRHVREFLWIFVNAKIENPSFDSQTKETLNTPRSKFGSTCEVPQKIVDSLCKVITERVLSRVNNKIDIDMSKKVQSAGRSRMINVPKLDDANDAGTAKGKFCTLILTEGESAKSMVTAGLVKIGRDRYGCFPLRGKVLNVRDSSRTQIQSCKEIQNLMKIIGLKPNEKYTSTDKLRYGSVMIMTDQDHDGSHIKGLLINVFHTMWPDLLNVPGFLVQFITPIVKAFPRGKERDTARGISFFTISDFLAFKEKQERLGKRWEYRYYKGLGTSSKQEAKQYFSDLETHKIDFVYDDAGEDDRAIEMAFASKKVDERKRWITGYAPNSEGVDYNIKQLGYSDFINKELILYSIAACERAIPSAIDGLKPGQRKILFCGFVSCATREAKVVQFSGYVLGHAAYHHGEKNLQDTIINMAQGFTGSNNLPYFKACGMFGTRATGGKDHAAARYISTKLDPITRALFPKVDDNLLVYKDDEGKPVEPEYYIPVIPTALLNGQLGIGSGFSTSIPSHNPRDLIAVTRALMYGKPLPELVPWYRGFTGEICPGRSPGKWMSKGVVEVVDSTVVRITEVPVKYWTDDFKDDMLKKQEEGLIIEFRNHMTGDVVDVDVALRPEVLSSLRARNLLLEFFNLVEHIHATNLMGFDKNHQLHKYATPHDIAKEWYAVRFDTYVARKKYLIDELERTCEKLRNMVRFITEVNEGVFNIRNRKRDAILKDLQERKYTPIFPVNKKKMAKTAIEEEPEGDGGEDEDEDDFEAALREKEKKDPHAGGFEYLLSMKLWSITYERARLLEEQLKRAQKDLVNLRNTTEVQMWETDLDALDAAITKADAEWTRDSNDNDNDDDDDAPRRPKGKPGKGKKAGKQMSRLSEKVVKIPKPGPDTAKAADLLEKLMKKFAQGSASTTATKRKQKAEGGDADEEDPDNVFDAVGSDDEANPPKKSRKTAAADQPKRLRAAKDADAPAVSGKKPKAAAKSAGRKRKKLDSSSSSTTSSDDGNDDGDTGDDATTSSGNDGNDSSDSGDIITSRLQQRKAPRAPKKEDSPPEPKKVKAEVKTEKKEKPAVKLETKSPVKPKEKTAIKLEKKSPTKPTKKSILSNLFDDDDDLVKFDPSNFGLDKLR